MRSSGGGATAAPDRGTTELMGHLLIFLLSWSATAWRMRRRSREIDKPTDKQTHIKTEINTVTQTLAKRATKLKDSIRQNDKQRKEAQEAVQLECRSVAYITTQAYQSGTNSCVQRREGQPLCRTGLWQ